VTVCASASGNVPRGKNVDAPKGAARVRGEGGGWGNQTGEGNRVHTNATALCWEKKVRRPGARGCNWGGERGGGGKGGGGGGREVAERLAVRLPSWALVASSADGGQ